MYDENIEELRATSGSAGKTARDYLTEDEVRPGCAMAISQYLTFGHLTGRFTPNSGHWPDSIAAGS